MNKVFFQIFVFIIMIVNLSNVYGQGDRGVLVYELDVFLDFEQTLNSSSLEEKDKNEAKNLIADFLNLQKSNLTKSIKETWIYAFDDKHIRRISGNRLFKGESFDLYLTQERLKTFRRFYKGDKSDLRIDTLDLNKNEKYRYEILEIDTSLYEIENYKCYKILVDEIKYTSRDSTTTHYEIYATKQIKIDFGFILDWREKVIDDCPVLLKS